MFKIKLAGCLLIVALFGVQVNNPKKILKFYIKHKLTPNLQRITSEFTTQDCRELGFIKSQLMCSSCEKLDDFGLEEIK